MEINLATRRFEAAAEGPRYNDVKEDFDGLATSSEV